MNAPETKLEIPTVPGTPFAGGFYAGRFFIGEHAYALVVAPKQEGGHEPTAWHTNFRKKVDGATHYADGQANTRAMLGAGSALAKWALDLRIGGHDDWYLPSRLELLVAYGNLHEPKALPDVEAFAEEWYWSSTQYAAVAAFAWIQSFHGHQFNYHKGYGNPARAVRRVAI